MGFEWNGNVVMRDSEVLYALVGILDGMYRAEKDDSSFYICGIYRGEMGESANCLLAATLNLRRIV